MMRISRVFVTVVALGLCVLAIEMVLSHPVVHASVSERSRNGGALDTTGEILRVVTVPVPTPTGQGISIAADCNGNLYYTNFLVPQLYKISATGELIDSVALHTATGATVNIDEMSWDVTRSLLWGAQDGTFRIYLIDPATGLCTFQFQGLTALPPIVITDGLAFDPTDNTLWDSPDVSDSIGHFTATGTYLGSIIPLGPTGNPDRDVSGISVGANNRLYVGHNGQGRISIVNKQTGAWIRDLGRPSGRVEGLECDAFNFAPAVVIWSKDALNNTVTAVETDSGQCACNATPDTCQFPFTQVDMGDLAQCSYPTLPNNPGHGLSGIAWLGLCVSGETTPHGAGQDSCNDGVTFLHTPWMPCTEETVRVVVTGGPNYARYQACGGALYLNAWKDGNLNGNFCDEISCVGNVASEWIIQDRPVQPGTLTIPVLDPGVFNMGIYSGVFRFRLTSQPVGRFGFGMRDTVACPNATCGTFGLDMLGEVEDYNLPDFQLAVTLSSLDAVAGDGSVVLRWVTASESANDHFEILRNGQNIAHVSSQGNGSVEHDYTYTDARLTNGNAYTYQLVAVDINGNRTELRSVSAVPGAQNGVITDYALNQNYPNPFNPTTEISYDLKDAGLVSLKIYNPLGEEVATLVNTTLPQGRHNVTFDATNLPSGLYFYRLSINGFVAEKKMLLMK